MKDGMELLILMHLSLVCGGLGLLWWAGDRVVRYSVDVARSFKVNTFFIGFVVLALAADIPELAVAISSAFSGAQEVSVGNVIGANFIDVAMVIGITLLLAGSVLMHKQESMRLVRMIGLSSFVLLILFMIGTLTSVHGYALIGIYIATLIWVWTKRNDVDYDDESVSGSDLEAVSELSRIGSVIRMFVCFGLVFLASKVTVDSAIHLATGLSLPLETVGATILAMGTSLPELVLSLSALRRKQFALALGPTLGTVLEQTTLILGVLTVLSDKPVHLAGLRGASIFMFLAFFIISYGLYRFSQVGRRTGATLVTLFFAYLAYQFSSGGLL
jgi:cation:H+ antiporter